jgi:FAD/FMN-containing dehydrogenase
VDYIAGIRACAADLKPWTGNGVYVNMLNADEDVPDRVVEAYGEAKYARLALIKAQYDPANFFRANYNITPR